MTHHHALVSSYLVDVPAQNLDTMQGVTLRRAATQRRAWRVDCTCGANTRQWSIWTQPLAIHYAIEHMKGTAQP